MLKSVRVGWSINIKGDVIHTFFWKLCQSTFICSYGSSSIKDFKMESCSASRLSPEMSCA